MCQFPSWIEKNDTVYFLDDKEVAKYRRDNPDKRWEDMVGHHGLQWVRPDTTGGVAKEGFPCPQAIGLAIRAGRMKQLMAASDESYTAVCLNDDNQLHNDDGPAIERANGDKEWWRNGKCYTPTKEESE